MSADSDTSPGRREGSLDAPTRHPLDWRSDDFHDEGSLFQELERVFDVCHGCRRCFSLCNAFPTLFDAIDESDTMELDGVPREVFWNVVDQCYLCDMCYMTKCPYVPPHEWNVDFPHLMLRAKAVKHREGRTRFRDKVLSSTDAVGKFAGIPIVVEAVNAANRNKPARALLEKTLGVHRDAAVPKYHAKTLRKRMKHHETLPDAAPAGETRGRVALFGTCYGNFNKPDLGEDLVAVFEHNGIAVRMAGAEKCCGMPKLELGDLDAVAKAKEHNVPMLAKLVDEGWDIIAPVPSCVLMFKQELPLMFPDDADVAKVRDAMFDPFEYLVARRHAGLLKTEFPNRLGKVAWQVPCHLRVQNIGYKTRDILQLVPGTEVVTIERCSGHDGTYAVKKEFHEISMKIAKPVINRVREAEADHYSSDCPMAGHQIENGLNDERSPEHPMALLRFAYGI
ncbi:MAG TPA: heterodisulfide reductase-related iron-sulfur binding cluster [Gammaproteobacteria bacterium]